MSTPENRRTVQIVGTIASLGLLAILLLRQDWTELIRLANSIPIGVFVAGLLLLAIRVTAHGMRWLSLLRAQDIEPSVRETLRLQWAGFYAGNFLPTSVGGDVVRLYGILPFAASKVTAAASIAVDRSLGVVSMLFFVPFSIPLLGSIVSGDTASKLVSIGAVVERASAAFQRFKQALALWASKPQSVLVALLASLIGTVCFLLMILMLAIALGIPVDFVDVAGASAMTYFIALIPFSINSYGIRELGVVFFYTRMGATSEQALALALLSRALLLLVSLPGALMIGKVLSGGVQPALED